MYSQIDATIAFCIFLGSISTFYVVSTLVCKAYDYLTRSDLQKSCDKLIT